MTNNNVRTVTVTLDYPSVNCLRTSFNESSKEGFSYISIPIVHSQFRREFFEGKCKHRKGPFTRSDLCLSSFEDWAAVIGNISPYVSCDSSDEFIRKFSEATLKQELSYACHLSLPAVMIPLRGPNVANLSRVIMSKLTPTTSIQIWVKVPLCHPVRQKNYLYKSEAEESEPAESTDDTWNWWNRVRLMCDSNKRVGVALEVGADVPSDAAILMRWLGEPVRAVVLPTHVFVTNKKGFPVLTKAHQALIRHLSTCHDINFVLTGTCRHYQMDNYVKYLSFLIQQKPLDPLASYTEGYEDFLQYPLQPLADNLESQTYEVFEKDPVKYNKYQEAIYRALMDRVSFEERDKKVQVVMVVGAGRGPLVTATLNAARKAQRRVKVYAVEKNDNAIVTLETKLMEEWSGGGGGDQVTVVSSDMRLFRPPELADIIVSELLGSFGDNELSPECLDGARHLMKDDAISIPASYTSYLCPIQSMRLYNEVRGYKERIIVKESHFEMPYVVHQKNRFTIDEPQQLFTFHHPNLDKEPDNTRYSSLTFEVKTTCVLHGFSGYFSTVLYKDTILSIHPETHSPGMFSWFPIYFPIKEPVNLNAGEKLVVNFWRLLDKEKVWYEWNISEPTPISIHNPNGRSYSIKLH